jgi:hypothetical protein
MAIDLSSEPVFPLNELRIRSRYGGKEVAYSTKWRWATRGVRGVRLETVRLGGTLYTSYAALSRFSNALSAGQDVPPPATSPRSAAARQRSSGLAEEELRSHGL